MVLVVEPQEMLLGEMVQVLRRAGYQAVGAEDFQEARRQIAIDPPRVLLARARLGAYSGMHLALLAQRRRSDCQVVIVGNSADRTCEAEFVNAGVALLDEPLPVTILPALISGLCGGPSFPRGPEFWRDQRFDRRQGDRRQLVIPGYTPERRMTDRRSAPV